MERKGKVRDDAACQLNQLHSLYRDVQRLGTSLGFHHLAGEVKSQAEDFSEV